MTSPATHADVHADVVVVGGGAGGLTAATHAARRGARTVLVSDGPLGGDCTHTGCVPSKTLLAAAAEGQSFDAAMRSVRGAIARIAATEDAEALARQGVEVVAGRAELHGAGVVHVDGNRLRAEHVILATGAAPVCPPVRGLTDVGPLTHETVFSLDRRPSSLAVLGAGSVGCELAQAFARLGTAVTLLDVAERVLPGEDADASAVIADALRRDGVTLRLGLQVRAACRETAGHRLELDDGTSVRVEHTLVAAGRRPVTGDLGADRVGIATDDDGHILVDDTCRTSIRNVWAVGDCTQLGGFTHVAAHMGFVAAANACRRRWRARRLRVDRQAVPRVTFTDPEVAQVGVREADAAASAGHAGVRVAALPLEQVDRAVTAGRTAGFVKLVAGPRPVLRSLGGGRLLGATIVAPAAGEMIHEAVLAMRTRMFTGRLAQAVHAYPTWSVGVQQAATQFFFATDGRQARPPRDPDVTRPSREEPSA